MCVSWPAAHQPCLAFKVTWRWLLAAGDFWCLLALGVRVQCYCLSIAVLDSLKLETQYLFALCYFLSSENCFRCLVYMKMLASQRAC